MVVLGLGDGQGEATGDGWRVFRGSPSTTSPPLSPPTFRGVEEPLCKVFSGLERVEEEDEDEEEEEDVVDEEEVVVLVVAEEDLVRGGGLAGAASVAKET